MPRYSFILKNGQPEDFELDLPNDAFAIEEALGTACGLLRDLEIPEIGKFGQCVEINESGNAVMTIEIHVTRSR